MADIESRNRFFDTLFSNNQLRWMGQNTNHIPLPESVIAAVKDSLVSDEFRAYAPPLGFEELRGAIIDDLGAKGATAIITDGGVEALYHICRTQTRKGDEFLTTDPGWKWPALFASAAGAELVEVPVYNQAYDYKLSADRLAERVTPRTKVIYVVDPNNPVT
jgi:aspartate/methionine/tyrosine aminotransferase